jgi:Ca2+:H+ antiporter
MTPHPADMPRRLGAFAFAYLLPLVALALPLTLDADTALAGLPPGTAMTMLALLEGALLLGTVFAALHHAETVATRLGEPLGTLVLTIAVTVIEVSIIVSMMLHGTNNPTLAREAVFSVVMIIGSGVVGLCLTVGALWHREQELRQQATSAFLSVLIALSVLTLILPDFAGDARPGAFGTGQLLFVCIASALLYLAFLAMQTGRHRADFLEATRSPTIPHPSHARPSLRAALVGVAFLLIGLFAVVLLAELVAASVEDGLAALEVKRPDRIVGAFIACLVLLPETISAVRAALANELQRSLNVALGSALATIGLTIPSVAAVSLLTGYDITLGLGNADMVLLVLTLTLSIVSFGTGRTNLLTGLVLLVVFAAYGLFLVAP